MIIELRADLAAHDALAVREDDVTLLLFRRSLRTDERDRLRPALLDALCAETRAAGVALRSGVAIPIPREEPTWLISAPAD